LKKILIIDGANLIHNFKYSYINGAVDNLIEPFLLEIQKLVHRLNPDIIVLGNDETRSRYRQELTEGYKSGRIKQQKKFTNKQIEAENLVRSLKSNLKLFNGLFIYGGVLGVEYDDIASILYHDERLKEYSKIIVSQDKDLLTTIKFEDVYDWKQERFKNREDIKGFTRDEWLFVQSLTGDPTDSFGGVKGIGIVTAEKLVQKYKSINNLLQNCYEDSFEEKDRYVKKALERLCSIEGKEELKLGYHLAKIFRDTSNLNETELKRYEEIVQDILNYKKPEPNSYVSETLDSYLLESRAYDAERIINEIGRFL
jgi:DNA polymerase-1